MLQQTLNFKGPVAAFQATLQSQGVRGLYRGVSTALWAASLEDAALFSSYEELKLRLGGEDSLSMCFVAGTGAGVIGGVILTPIELVKWCVCPSSSTGGDIF